MTKSPFSLDHSPPIGEIEVLAEDLQVITAPNAGPMTFTGTRSYLLGNSHVVLIDPGPDVESHKSAIMTALRGRTLEAIVVTHSHVDHSPLASVVARETGVPVYGCSKPLAASSEITVDIGGFSGGEGVDRAFQADVDLIDNQVIEGTGWRLEAIHTPGHLNDHMCFSDGERLFSGDHVMGWATSMISPPEGNLTAFMASLERLLERPEQLYVPGHGAVVENGPAIARFILEHRRRREAQILAVLENGARSIEAITAEIYANVDKALHMAASRNVLSHLIDLYVRHMVACEGDFSVSGQFRLVQK